MESREDRKWNTTEDCIEGKINSVKSKYFIILIWLLISFNISGCTNRNSVEFKKDNVEENGMSQKRTDIETLQKWFPCLNGIQSAEWETEILGSNEQEQIPGPGTFRACGYIVLDSDIAKQYHDGYQWEAVDKKINMNIVDQSLYKDCIWNYSKEWEDEVKPGYYIGNFYLSNRVVMFDIVR